MSESAGAGTAIGVYVGPRGKSMVSIFDLESGRFNFRRLSVSLPSVISLIQLQEPRIVVLYVDHPAPTARTKIMLDVANRTGFWEQACATQGTIVFRVGSLVLQEAYDRKAPARFKEQIGRRLTREEVMAAASAVYGCRLLSDKTPPVINVLSNLTSWAA